MKENKNKTLIILILLGILLIVGIVITIIVINNDTKKSDNLANNVHKPEYSEDTYEMSEYGYNVDKYGLKVNYVSKYEKKKDKKIGWRLFYEDSDYAYLIADNVIGNYFLPDYISKYDNIDSISKIGRKVNSKLFDAYELNKKYVSWNLAMQATAWLTDNTKWKDLLDDDGRAVFAIASPTIELYMNSYNASKIYDDNREVGENDFDVEYNSSENGYEIIRKSNSEKYPDIKIDENYKNGIYSKGNFWIASPTPMRKLLAAYQTGDNIIMCMSNRNLKATGIR